MLLVTRGRVTLGRGIVVIAATDEQNTCGYLRVFAGICGLYGDSDGDSDGDSE